MNYRPRQHKFHLAGRQRTRQNIAFHKVSSLQRLYFTRLFVLLQVFCVFHALLRCNTSFADCECENYRVSVHGSQIRTIENRKHLRAGDICEESVQFAAGRIARWDKSGGEHPDAVREDMRDVVQNHFGVFRTEENMRDGLEKFSQLRMRLQSASIGDKSKVYNTARIEALELENTMAVAAATLYSAIARTESRGAHARDDYQERDDANWIRHTLYFAESDRLDYRPVQMQPLTVETFPPKKRTY